VLYLLFFSDQLITALPLVISFPRFYLKTDALESEHATRLREKLALFVHSFDLRFFVACESMGAQISKNGAKEETAAEKPVETANKSNGQVITLIIFFVQACCVLRGCALPKIKSVQMNNEPINKGTLHFSLKINTLY